MLAKFKKKKKKKNIYIYIYLRIISPVGQKNSCGKNSSVTNLSF